MSREDVSNSEEEETSESSKSAVGRMYDACHFIRGSLASVQIPETTPAPASACTEMTRVQGPRFLKYSCEHLYHQWALK